MAYKQLKLWFYEDLAAMLSDKILLIEPGFAKINFVNAVSIAIPELELKDRVASISKLLHSFLGNDFIYGINVLSQILGPENEKEIDMFKEYYWIMPIAKYVEDYGLENWKESIGALEEITKRNTAEYAIRPFIRKYTDKSLQQMEDWSLDSNKHIRRLASEGGRPRLPWATKLQIFIDDPNPLLPILNNLKNDPSKYVQNSVANCINDILKDNYAIGKKLIEDWVPDAGKERKWIIKHAIRNFRKRDDPWALDVVSRL